MKLLRLSIAIALLCTAVFADAPQQITGRVIDQSSQKPVENAVFYIESTNQFVQSDANGTFKMNVLPGEYVAQIMRVGYETAVQTIAIRESAAQTMLIELKQQPVTVEDITVTEKASSLTLQSDVYAREISETSPKDVGLFLRSQPGFGAIRRGGYAIDPVMRGFKYEQLNVQFDGGIKVSHACPNRMDPVTSHIRAQDLEKIEIIKGPYTVRYGQTLGGVVNLVQKRPALTQTLNAHAEIESGYDSNGDSRTARGAVTISDQKFDLFISGGTQDAGNYENGDGVEIPSSYRVNDYLIRAGFRPAENHRLQFSWRQSFVRDVLHAALPMDSDLDDTDIWAVDYAAQHLGKTVFSLNAKVFGSAADHVMSNTLRPNYRMTHAVATVNSEMLGGKIEIGLTPAAKTLWYFGADAQSTAKNGFRERDVYMMNGMMFNPPREFTDFIWQDSELQNAGIFSEVRQSLSPKTTIVAGARVDFVQSKINDPAPQFTAEYGEIGTEKETNLSVTATLNHRLNAKTELQLAAGRGIRSANLTERYINHLSVGVDAYEYFGNPYLKPEVNHQADLSVNRHLGNHTVRANVFYSLINDYISAFVDENMPRVYMPGTEPLFTKRFENIDRARQTGFELSLGGELGKGFSYHSGIAYTHATDLQRDQPLAEIPPLAGQLRLRYDRGGYFAESDLRIVARQDRISSAFGESETPGFSVANFRAGWQFLTFAEAIIAVENLFNENYYEHLNRSYTNMPEAGMLYEPGRNVHLQLKLSR